MATIEEVMKRVERRLEKVLKESVIIVSSRVALDTPRDTHTLASNWNSSVGSPDLSVDMDDQSDQAVARNIQEVSKWNLIDDFWFTNNTEYAALIEFGGYSHTKAPNGMVKINVDNFENIVSHVSNKYKNSK